ncbi:MAG: PD-(D/E)XK nuclease family protein [Tepidisphaeraceae bacterium]|jgi:ATP-dependent helicase/nuclease subunit B
MSVRFILGRAGTGKTHWCLQRIGQALRQSPLGPPIYWILPRQATFQAQRQLACDGNGYFRARVVSFEDLAQEILAECGGSATAEVSDLGRRMILGHLLRKLQPQLRYFREVAHQPGVAAELDATFAELQRCGVSAAELDRDGGGHGGPGADPSLESKLHDLAIVDAAYTQFLGQDRLDPTRRLAEALAAIQRCPSLRQAEVYVDSFYEFTRYQCQVLAALAKVCRSVCITLTLDPQSPSIHDAHKIPDELDLLHKTTAAYRRLWFTFSENGLPVEEPVLLQEPRRFAPANLAAIERWQKGDGRQRADGSIQLIEAPDRRAEVDAAARWIGQLIRQGMRYRDVAVLMRSEPEYRDLIDASFAEHGIPFFSDRRRTASHHPLLRLIRASLAVARTNWGHEAIISTIKTGLAGLGDDEADALENYVLQQGIRHGMWIDPAPWTARRRRGDDADDPDGQSIDAQRIEILRRRLVDRLGPFVQAVTAKPQSTSVKSLAAAIFSLLESLQVRAKIVAWMDQAEACHRLEERSEHERVWDELVRLFDEMVDLLGDEPISLEDFAAILDTALEGFDLALTPPTVDQVLVGPVDRTRTPDIKACVVLGLSEGQFPRGLRQDTVFSDVDRRALGRRNFDLDPDTQRRLLDENFWFYVAMTRASHRLLLTRSTSGKSAEPIGPSPLWRQVAALFADLPTTQAPASDQLPLESIATPRQLISGLMRWVRDPRSQDADAWRALYQWLAEHEPCGDRLDLMRHRAWKALAQDNEPHLEPDRGSALFASPLHAALSQLESFRACPYQHFARYGLGLAPRQRRQVTALELSRLYHDVLARLMEDLKRQNRSWSDLDQQEIEPMVAELMTAVGRQAHGELMLSSARNRYLLDRIGRTLKWVAAAQQAAGGCGDFKAGWSNVHFGHDPRRPPPTDGRLLPPLAIDTPAGNQVLVRGTIDRVDVLADGSACAVDYRLWAKGLDASAAFHGLTLRLLTYLLALEKNGGDLGTRKLRPAAAFCVQLLRSLRDQNPDDAPGPDDPRFHLLNKPRGIFDLRVAGMLDKNLNTGHSQVVQLHIKKDGGVGHAEHSDAVRDEQLAALLAHVENRLGESADGILAGKIAIRPYRLGKCTACAACEFRDVCRFQPRPRAYDDLPAMSREEMLQRVLEKGEHT